MSCRTATLSCRQAPACRRNGGALARRSGAGMLQVRAAARVTQRKAGANSRRVAAVREDREESQTLVERLFAAGEIDSSLALAAVTVGIATVAAAIAAEPSQAAEIAGDPSIHPIAADINNMAAEEDLLSNLAKYARFAISLSTGTIYVILKPFAGLLKKPVTAVLLVVGLVGFVFFLNFTINAMLGITDPVDYQFSPIE